MSTFGNRLRELRMQNKLGQKEIGALLSVSDSSIRKYESGDRTPAPDAIKKLAEYFNVSTDYLLGHEKINSNLPELNAKDERDIAKELEKMMNNLDSDSGLSFYGQPLTDENKEILRASLENTLRMSKALAKKKFTPKKYRKEE